MRDVRRIADGSIDMEVFSRVLDFFANEQPHVEGFLTMFSTVVRAPVAISVRPGNRGEIIFGVAADYEGEKHFAEGPSLRHAAEKILIGVADLGKSRGK